MTQSDPIHPMPDPMVEFGELRLVLEQQDRDLERHRARIAELEAGLRDACNWISDRSPDGSMLVDRLRALAFGSP